MSAEPDAGFADPRLAATYDVFEAPRDDLDAYVQIVAEFGAERVLDIGCGTGEFACRLALGGIDVVGVDPAAASVEIARTKSGAERVTWVVGTVSDLGALSVDLATMTANVAQVFVTDDQWADVVEAAASRIRSGGLLVFETRDPQRRAWEGWTPEATRTTAELADGDVATTWCRVTAVDLPLVSFRFMTTFESDGATLISDSTLRFRDREEIDRSLDAAGFDVVDVRDAPDRPGREWVYLAQRR